jgi:class 3 adenylate cyclase
VEASYTPGGEAEILKSIPCKNIIPESVLSYVLHSLKELVINDASQETRLLTPDEIIRYKSLMCLPLLNQGELSGILFLENSLATNSFTVNNRDALNLLAGQIVVSMQNAFIYSSYIRFIPGEFLQLLGKKSIIDVSLGDSIQKNMTVLFADIRNFTRRSEEMTPAENFAFMNEYNSLMEPIIRHNGGFIDKYMGDGIMALFSSTPDDALTAAINMIKSLNRYNENRFQNNKDNISIGIGLNTGNIMLGAVGDEKRMDITVISDAVNVSSRIQVLTKLLGGSLLITEEVFSRLKDPSKYMMRSMGERLIRGKSRRVKVYEVFDADTPQLKELKKKTIKEFEKAVSLYDEKNKQEAIALFKTMSPDDPAVNKWIDFIGD